MTKKDHEIQFKLIYKLAWNFYQNNGVELDELISEASLQYSEVLNIFDGIETDDKHFISYAYKAITNSLILFCRKNKKMSAIDSDPEYEPSVIYKYGEGEFGDFDVDNYTTGWSDDCKFVVSTVLDNNTKFNRMTPKSGRGWIIRMLKAYKWKNERIWRVLDELKKLINETDGYCII